MLVFTACAQSNQSYDEMLNQLYSHSVDTISSSRIDEDVIFLDARELEEFEVSHIKDAIHVGYDNFDIKKLKNISRERKIVVYCTVGYRSEKIGEELKKAGYSDVYNLYGGLFSWFDGGNMVYDMNGEVTQEVHTYDESWSKWLNTGKKVF